MPSTEILSWLKCLAMSLLCFALAGVVPCIYELPDALNAQASMTRTLVLADARKAESDANNAILAALALIDKRSAEALGEIHQIGVDANNRTGEALAIVRATADLNSKTIAAFGEGSQEQLAAFNATVATVAKPLAETTQQLDDALPLWLDCEYNPDCAFNRYQGVSKAIEQTAQAVAKAAPAIAIDADAIAASGAGVAASADATGREVTIAAKRFNAPQSKWAQLRSWLLTIARIYGAI